MKMIQPNCRVQFAAEDIDFILSVLAARSAMPSAWSNYWATRTRAI